MPTQSELKQAAAIKLANAANQNITFNGNSYANYWFNLAEMAILAAMARTQDPLGTRTVTVPTGSTYDVVEMTNADYIAFVDDIVEPRQKAYDAYKTVSDAIDANTITDYGALDTAWDNSIANYTAPTELPSLADLADGKADKANFAALSTLAAHGISNAATNAPADVKTDYGLLATILGSDMNTLNAKQNAIATNLNALATAFNTLLTKVTAHETAINALKSAGAA